MVETLGVPGEEQEKRTFVFAGPLKAKLASVESLGLALEQQTRIAGIRERVVALEENPPGFITQLIEFTKILVELTVIEAAIRKAQHNEVAEKAIGRRGQRYGELIERLEELDSKSSAYEKNSLEPEMENSLNRQKKFNEIGDKWVAGEEDPTVESAIKNVVVAGERNLRSQKETRSGGAAES